MYAFDFGDLPLSPISADIICICHLQNYVMFNLLNKEFTFTVNDGELDCGLNGALYFVEMQKDGGLSGRRFNHGVVSLYYVLCGKI